MKKTLFLAIACILAGITLHAQTTPALKKVMELNMPKTADDDMPGTRGASVVWHPVQKEYYAVFAGNMGYPLGVFDKKGTRLSPDEQKAMMDSRGLWYNPVTKLICGNTYDDYGWFTYKLDRKGIPTDYTVTNEGMNQPDAQSVGAYNPTAKQVLFLFLDKVYMYNSDAELQDSLMIHWGLKEADATAEDHEDNSMTPEDYNYTSLIYTGIKGQELGFLNTTGKQVELYNIKTGFLTRTISFPASAITEASFNFAYANGIYWLFDMELRKWEGYK